MQQTKTHVRKLRNPDFIGSYELIGDNGTAFDLNVQISSVEKKQVHNGKKLDDCTVINLVGHKPFILNVVNEKKLTKILKSPFIEDWTGKWFTLYVAKIRYDGDTVDALRIRDVVPTVTQQIVKEPVKTPVFDSTHTKFLEIVEKIKDGFGSIEILKQSFIVTPETEAEINRLVSLQSNEDELI